MNSFSYTISSSDNYVNGVITANSANSVNVQFTLPSKNRFFKCRVKNFIINPASFTIGATAGRFVNLVSPNLSSDGLYNSGNRNSQIIAFCDLNSGINNQVNTIFYIENPNGKLITFYLQDENYTSLVGRINQNALTTQWILTLEFTPIDEEYQSKQHLRNGL